MLGSVVFLEVLLLVSLATSCDLEKCGDGLPYSNPVADEDEAAEVCDPRKTRKRKLSDSTSCPTSQQGEGAFPMPVESGPADFSSAPDFSCTIESARQAATLNDYYDPLDTALTQLLSILQEGPLEDADGCTALSLRLDGVKCNLLQWLASKPCHGLVKVSNVMEIVREQLLERVRHSTYSCSPGPFEWAAVLKNDVEGWHELSEKDLEEEIEEVNFRIEEHVQLVEYCVEAFRELLQEERAAYASDSFRVQRMPQQRLQSSLVNR